jgi:hypothetical protein
VNTGQKNSSLFWNKQAQEMHRRVIAAGATPARSVAAIAPRPHSGCPRQVTRQTATVILAAYSTGTAPDEETPPHAKPLIEADCRTPRQSPGLLLDAGTALQSHRHATPREASPPAHLEFR